MKLFFYRGQQPNFGDELNTWLLPQVFPAFFDEDPRTLFLGIGSILYDHHPPQARKIVFGAGYGGYTVPPRIDESWTVYCVRGPKTAAICRLPLETVAADPAILVNRYYPTQDWRRRQEEDRARGAAFMPHFESVRHGRWKEACRLAGLKFIDPRGEVETVLDEIAGCSVLVTEAMHGAIVADALRVPFVPALPLHQSHRMKWLDWAKALDIELRPLRLWPSSAQEAFVSYKQRRSYKLDHPSAPLSVAIEMADVALTFTAALRLSQLAAKEPTLSSDAALDRALDRLQTHATQLTKDFAR